MAAARRALAAGDVELALPFVPEQAETEVREMFAMVLPVRESHPDAQQVADRLFLETVVRVHRAGEGAPYTGLKPAGTPVGPVIPLAEHAVDTGSADELTAFLIELLGKELAGRLEHVRTLSGRPQDPLPDRRRYVEAMLGFEVYCHSVFRALTQRTDRHGPA